ncbi:MAG: hypothetical protein PWQ67_675 [Clostridia bacterium]|jgi:hypothetical protein|nr:hypothetical protein [Clostridia bacterium]MDN5322221.1 hypothetical protein [Clostridia bacterium]
MEQFFLVVVPEDQVKSKALEIRNKINRRFQIYGGFKPALHTTVEVIKPQNSEDLSKAKAIIKQISKQFRPFTLEVTGFNFFPPPFKAITLAINKNNEIEILSSLIYEALAEKGMIGREDLRSWKFHITVASPFGAVREWSVEEFDLACEMIKDEPVCEKCIIDRLELWRPIFDPQKMCEATFPLKKSLG